jgi:hypothetical protein
MGARRPRCSTGADRAAFEDERNAVLAEIRERRPETRELNDHARADAQASAALKRDFGAPYSLRSTSGRVKKGGRPDATLEGSRRRATAVPQIKNED